MLEVDVVTGEAGGGGCGDGCRTGEVDVGQCHGENAGENMPEEGLEIGVGTGSRKKKDSKNGEKKVLKPLVCVTADDGLQA
jgi:hypothetical protein